MNDRAPGDDSLEDRRSELLRRNDSLRNELQDLRESSVQLSRRLEAAALGLEADRQLRRAALNLMEDAVASRTAERRENDERRRVEEELREASRRKDQFLATLAHELRNPLAPIRNGIRILRSDRADPQASERVLEAMDRQVEHLARLVEDLMEVSRITRGRIDLRRVRVDLATIVNSAVETIRAQATESGHQLDVALPDEPLILEADPVRMVQVVGNLLSNAVKYTPEPGRIQLSACREGRCAVLRVRDTGMGIPEEMLDRVFDLFTQGDRTYSRAQGGLGIGLTLVRSLVELHGGAVEVHSEGPGRGSEFLVTIPALPPGSVAELGMPARFEAAYSGRVLVVDDNVDSAESLQMFLQMVGAEVRVAHDGPAALEAIRAYRPEVVLLDIGMPGMDGHEVARRAREMPEGREATLIALTGWGQEEDRRRSREAGIDHHLLKPVEPEMLMSLLAAVR